MAKYAIVNQSSIVNNIIEWDGVGQWSPPEGCTAIPTENANCIIWATDDQGVNQQIEFVGFVEIGALWDGQKFVNPEPPMPEPEVEALPE